MKPEISYQRAVDSVFQALEKASTALDQCVFPGPNQAAAIRSKMDLLIELIRDEPAEIGVSQDIIEKFGVE